MSTYRTPTPAELARAGAAMDAALGDGDRASREIVARSFSPDPYAGEVCWHRSYNGIACGKPAAAYVDRKWLCGLHAQGAATLNKGRKRK